MKTYYIIGAGGFAKDVYFLAESVLTDNKFQFGGFIDIEPASDKITVRGKTEKLLDENKFLKNSKPTDDISLFIGIANPDIIKNIKNKYNNYEFPNLMANDFICDFRSLKIGNGNIITSGTIFTVDIEVGSFNVFNVGTKIGHDSKIGNFNVFNPGTTISGEVIIGSNNFFGTNSTVLQQLKIGNHLILGASALLTRDITSAGTYIGVPAKQIKKDE